VISELDIWRAANLLIRQHGADAALEAARLQALVFDRGDDKGRLVWAQIRRAIQALQADQRTKATLRLSPLAPRPQNPERCGNQSAAKQAAG
jgi:hypothetical protein